MASDETIAACGLDAISKSLAAAIPSPVTENAVCETTCVERNNGEYMAVFRTIAALRSQLARAKGDMEILERLRGQALANPLAYVESVISDAAPKAPGRQDVVDVPAINVEPYLSCASPAAVDRYLRIAAPAAGTQNGRGGGLIGLRSAPARAASARSSSYASAKSGRRGQRPAAAAPGQLTGATAVATPEYSPPPAKSQPRDDVGARQNSLAGAIVQSAPVGAFEGTGALHQGSHAPVASRANTEPLHARPSVVSPLHAETQPSTPTRRGKSQKTLTPQIMAEFRQQAAEESQRVPDPSARGAGSDDDDYYTHLAASVSEAFGNAAAAEQQPPGNRFSGKSLLFSGIPQPPVKRKRGRPKSNAPSAAKARKQKHRGPTRPESGAPKPLSYNQPWNDEEQTRLENLLIEYPEEEVANDRWRKISEALGSRTMRQVASRVQKYFIKLSKAGLPVPGRVPDTSSWTSLGKRDPAAEHWSTGTPRRRAAGFGPQKHKNVDFTSSEEDDVDIDLDDDSDAGPVPDRKGKQADTSAAIDDDVIEFGGTEFQLSASSGWAGGSGANGASTSTAHVQTPALRSAKAVHLGYRCDSCLAEPIVGIRWHCVVCRGAQTVDLCDECREEASFETDWHTEAHNFKAIHDAEMEPYYANEVAAPALQEFSYLA